MGSLIQVGTYCFFLCHGESYLETWLLHWTNDPINEWFRARLYINSTQMFSAFLIECIQSDLEKIIMKPVQCESCSIHAVFLKCDDHLRNSLTHSWEKWCVTNLTSPDRVSAVYSQLLKTLSSECVPNIEIHIASSSFSFLSRSTIGIDNIMTWKQYFST